MLKPPPIIDKIANGNMQVLSTWGLWFRSITKAINAPSSASGTFTTADAKTVTVVNGIITSIV